METETNTTNEIAACDAPAFGQALKAQIKATGRRKAFYAKHDVIKKLLKTTGQTLLKV